MLILPAIDLKDGRCVRLRQGRADQATVYSDDPVEMAQRWVDEGAEYLHIVDLSGAFDGRPIHADVISRIAHTINIPFQVGGGLRTDADIQTMLELGAARVIVGTRAFTEPAALGALADAFGDQIAVGIDARDGFVQVRGWVETTPMTALDLATQVDALGIRTLIVTDTATDGMLAGVNADGIAAVCAAVSCTVIASGGVSSPADVTKLNAIGCNNLGGAIVGKALYDGTVSLKDLMAAG